MKQTTYSRAGLCQIMFIEVDTPEVSMPVTQASVKSDENVHL